MDATRYVDWPNNLTRSELVGLLRSFATEALDIEHILGQALGMPIDHDGEHGPAGMPMVGEHTALTLAMAAAKRLGEIDAELDQCNAKERAAGLTLNHRQET
jgi:hypothetical protein